MKATLLALLALLCAWLAFAVKKQVPFQNSKPAVHAVENSGENIYKKVEEIPLPAGFKRLPLPPGAFGSWLRQLPLKRDKTVYLFNGEKKAYQQAQYAVVAVSVGDKDLQQCADAVMRLYAEYHFAQQAYDKIHYRSVEGTVMDYNSYRNGTRYISSGHKLLAQQSGRACTRSAHDCLMQYLETVFAYASTLSLSKELQPVTDINTIQPGDVFIKGGSPGHAVIVTDVAVNEQTQQRIFMLAQSYMPAQDIHILLNPVNEGSPWYSTRFTGDLYTPQWVFHQNQLSRFPGN